MPLVLTDFYYLTDYGKNTPPPGCCQRLSVRYKSWDYKRGWLKLEICWKDQPDEVFVSETEATTGHELALLVEEYNPRKWLGQEPDASSYWLHFLIYEGFNYWKLTLDYVTGLKNCHEGVKKCHEGKDTGEKSDPDHLAFERDLLKYAQQKLETLRASRPRHVQSLNCMVVTPEAPCHWRLVDYEDGNRALLQRRQGQREEEVYVHPELVSRITALLFQKYRAEDWHDFTSPGWTDMTPRACEFMLTYNTKQHILVRGIAGKADCVPPGFNPAMRELLAALHEAMYNPTRHVPPWNRPHGLTAFHYRGGAWGNDTEYSTYWRLDPEGKVLRLKRYVDTDKAECTLRVEDVDKLEAVLAESGMLSWNGFDEHDNFVFDSFGFKLSISFADGRTVKADGYHRCPGGDWDAFNATTKKVFEYLDLLLPGKSPKH